MVVPFFWTLCSMVVYARVEIQYYSFDTKSWQVW